MPESNPIVKKFLDQITSIVEANVANEQFGVSELADQMSMSRSNLLRKVKKLTGLSVSQLIRQIRLNRGMALLKSSSLNISEISYRVGFGSTSYFIKCFREFYGYPPGEAEQKGYDLKGAVEKSRRSPVRIYVLGGVSGFILLLAAVYFLLGVNDLKKPITLEKSIAVLPFKNESNDSTNLYFINGLMESTLTNLQKIKDLKVISRTSAEKYRNSSKSIPEMASELNVNYFVEGSGQKMGDKILLNIQLIEASTDNHLWSRQYQRETSDIFELQQEIAKNIADEIQAVITPEERLQIEKRPTDNLEAYDLFLKGRDLMAMGNNKGLQEAIGYYKKAIQLDDQFAQAYAEAAIAYFYLDLYQAEKKYFLEIENYANNAMARDDKLAQSLVAKAISYMQVKDYEKALPYLEKALEFNPNSVMVINFLSDFYNNLIPNTTKYLEYALIGARLDIASFDSTTTSYNYLHLSNALIQNGFIDESLKYINKSLDYFPDNPFSRYVKPYILFARDHDLPQLREMMITEFKKDTSRIDIMQEVAKICYLQRDWDSAYYYYNRFIEVREKRQLDIYKHESLKMAIVLDKAGEKERSKEMLKAFKDYADNDHSIYKNLQLAGYYAFIGEREKIVENMRLFARENDFQFWILLFPDDPISDYMPDCKECDEIWIKVESSFWESHNKLRIMLEEKKLI